MASRAPHGAKYTRHFLANHVIEATPDGAVGKQYLVAVDIGESGQPSSIFLGGHYEDVYAKTPEGWRFKTRTFIASATGDGGEMTSGRPLTTALGIAILAMLALTVLPAQQREATTASRPSATSLTSLDYLEIQQLVRKSAWALDSGDNYGYAYADLFTPDGVFVGTNQGHGRPDDIRAATSWRRSRAEEHAARRCKATSR